MKQNINIFKFIDNDLNTLDNNLKKMVGAKHPILYAAAEHLFNAKGKNIKQKQGSIKCSGLALVPS